MSATKYVIESEFPAGGKRTIHSVAVTADDAKEAINALAIRYVCDSTNVTSVAEVSVFENDKSVPAKVGTYAVADGDKVKIVKVSETVDKGWIVNGKKLETAPVGVFYSVAAELDVVPVSAVSARKLANDANVDTLHKQLDTTSDENARLHSELAVMNSKLVNRVAYIDKLETDLKSAANPPELVSKIVHLEQDAASLSSQVDDCERRYASLLSSLNSATNETEVELTKMQTRHAEEVVEFAREIGTLVSANKALTSDKESLNRYIDDLNELMATTESQLETTLTNLELTTSKLHATQDEVLLLEDKADSLLVQIDAEKIATKRVIDTLQKTREDNLSLREELVTVKEQLLTSRPLPPPPPAAPLTLKLKSPSDSRDKTYNSVVEELKTRFSPPMKQEVVPAPEWMVTDPLPNLAKPIVPSSFLPSFDFFRDMGTPEPKKDMFDLATIVAAKYASAHPIGISNPFGDAAPLLTLGDIPSDSDFDSSDEEDTSFVLDV